MFDSRIYVDDFIELYIKIRQRGTKFIFSKVHPNAQRRTTSAFEVDFEHANWWIIPSLKRRFNTKISGNPDISYEEFINEKYFSGKKIHIVSPGCGSGSHELALAAMNPDISIQGYDISEELTTYAESQASQLQLSERCKFFAQDITKVYFEPASVDVFLFHSSLHHFYNVEMLLRDTVIPALKVGGSVVIHEYVGANRLQTSAPQVDYCNKVLHKIPVSQRKILGTNLVKEHCYRQGIWRMRISDPSECVDAEQILPSLRKLMKEEMYVPLGGNIAMPVLKHIAHHFVNTNEDTLQMIFDSEDEYLENNASDYVFGMYKKME